MTRKVTGRILAAPPTWLATSVAANVEAVAAATMPRGAIQPMNARSPLVRSVRTVARQRHQRPDHQHQDGDQAERRQHQVSQRRRGDRGRDGDEQHPDDQLDQGLEERPPGRDVEAAQVRHGQPHDDRGDQPGVVADDVAGGRHGDHARRAGPWCRAPRPGRACAGSNHSSAVPTAPPTSADADADQELPHLVAEAPWLRSATTAWNTTAPRMPPTGSISEPSQARIRWSRSVGRTKRSSGPDHGRPGHHQDRAEHQRRAGRTCPAAGRRARRRRPR